MSKTEDTKVVAVTKKKYDDITQNVLDKIKTFESSKEIIMPKNFSPENALKAAYLILSETVDKHNVSVLQSCDNISLGKALLKMVVWGLSPLKGQCYFIPYAGKLECFPSYKGNIALAKRFGGLQDINAVVVYEEDEFNFKIDFETGVKVVTKHEQKLESLGSKKIKGVYAIRNMKDGSVNTEIMNWAEVQDAWNQRKGNGLTPAHNKFPGEMAKRTVINRCLKLVIGSSDDSVLYSDDDLTSKDDVDITAEDVSHEIKTQANSSELNIDDAVVEEAVVLDESSQPENKEKETLKETTKKEQEAPVSNEAPF